MIGGTLIVQSEVGQGSHFSFTHALRLAEEEQTQIPAPETRHRSQLWQVSGSGTRCRRFPYQHRTNGADGQGTGLRRVSARIPARKRRFGHDDRIRPHLDRFFLCPA